MIIDCLNNMHHTEDEVSIARMAARARNYTLIEGILYKKGLSNRYSSAYLKAKAKTFYKKFIQVHAAHTSVQGHYLRRPLGKGSISLPT